MEPTSLAPTTPRRRHPPIARPDGPHRLLESTYIHVPGIGPKTERRLWDNGFTTWDRFRDRFAGSHRGAILPLLNVDEVLRSLPRSELWRLYPRYLGRTAFLDIETTGYSEEITCVGVYDGSLARTFVLGRNLWDFPAAVEPYDLLVTFNGAQFDLPILERAFPEARLDERLHVDLRFALRRLGLRGGLKRIEREVGLDRGPVAGLSGWSAVHLWRLHRRGHLGALPTLERYNLEDVLNLEPLLCHLYNEEISRTPLGLQPLEPRPRPELEQEVDYELVEWLLDRAELAAAYSPD